MKESKVDLGPTGQSRRRWMLTSAAVVAGSVTACGSESGGGATDPNCDPGAAPPAQLPGFGAARCTDQITSPAPAPDDDRFVAWNEELRRKAGGRESAIVDLDAIDHNLKLVGQTLGSSIALRLVAKSLPSVQLLEYMMVTGCTNRIMAFSEGMVRDLLWRFGSDVDILLGRPATVEAATRTFDTLDAQSMGGPNPAASVRWLVDTAERMQEYATLAGERGVALNVAVEIDVGLRRGGARTNDELLAMLALIDSSPLLQLAGFMGYEGHVPFAEGTAQQDEEFSSVQQRYQGFVDAARAAYPSMFDEPLVYNSGGSRTYHYYTDDLDTPVNEVAMGSAFFYPDDFSNIPETELRPATFLATPVTKRIDPAEVPFVPGLLPGLAETDSSYEVQYVVVAGSFPGEQRYPQGLMVNSLTSTTGDGKGVVNLLSNQAEWLGARSVPLDVGDFIFFHPWEGDGVRWLARLDVFRAGELVDQWPTFQPGIRLS